MAISFFSEFTESFFNPRRLTSIPLEGPLKSYIGFVTAKKQPLSAVSKEFISIVEEVLSDHLQKKGNLHDTN
ncbi:hypothetical protein [Desulfitobacterium sp. PCE1]|uniref:hypothetical protein n=1 Tax=Desulfitobacterium sp. PCE1 TaxID=146907 RepID=UPI00037C8DCA|nr:hypothetical protein [Desulfitobacterium sp. PCE1]